MSKRGLSLFVSAVMLTMFALTGIVVQLSRQKSKHFIMN